MKGNPFFGTMRGKLGETVFYRSLGEQKARTYLRTIKNPRSFVQMVNRTNLTNLVRFYRLSNNLIRTGFTDKKSNQSDYNRFVSINKSTKPVYLTKEEAQMQDLIILAPYQLTSGTLSPIVSYAYDGTTNRFYFNMQGLAAGATPAQIRAAYLNSFSDAQENDSLVLVSYVPIEGTFLMKTVDIDIADDGSLGGNLSVVTINEKPVVVVTASAGAAASALIRCRKSNGILEVSAQSVILSADYVNQYTLYSSQLKADEAALSYGATDQSILNAAADNSNYYVFQGINDVPSKYQFNPVFPKKSNVSHLYALVKNYLRSDDLTFSFELLSGFGTTGINNLQFEKSDETEGDGVVIADLTGSGWNASVEADYPATFNLIAQINGKSVSLGNITFTAK
jgi:hypothetical protein